MSYDGFISYSHAADDLLAPRLQAGLGRFAKPWWKRRALRVFRDESSLSANPHLWESITQALDSSGCFVLLLSPDAAESEWVNQEIYYWTEHKDASRILPVVTGGEFGWADGDVTGDCVPDALRGVFPSEPRWVDLRFAKGEEQLDLQDPRFADAVADIASAMRGVPKDELAGEEVRQHRRTVRTAWAAGALLVTLAVAVTWAGVLSARNAEEARAQARFAHDAATAEAIARSEAQQAAEDAIEQAERADRTARRLIEFVVQPDVGETSVIEIPVGVIPRGLPPAEMSVLTEVPGSVRLDFWQQLCLAEACFREPTWADESQSVRVPYGEWKRPLFYADTPFHVRHGFTGLPSADPVVLRAAGYSARLYVKAEALDAGEFAAGETYYYDASALVIGHDASCGPGLFAGSEGCVSWLFEFPEGLPAGLYAVILEWTAPCGAWFETDVCDSPTRPIQLRYSDGFVFPIDAAYKERFPEWEQIPDFPWDPWADAEPIPESTP